MRCLSFIVDDGLFAADVTLVQKVVRKMAVTPVPPAPDEIIGISNLKGRVVTVLSLYELLGHKEKNGGQPITDIVNAVIFKSFSEGEDQIGLSIDKPGNLIDINDDQICQPSLATGAEESFCISGIAEVDSQLYRIINVDSIINKFKDAGELENKKYGGLENDAKD